MFPLNRTNQFFSREWLVPALLFALSVIAFLPAMQGQFVWDDEAAIYKNMLLRHWAGLWTVWTTVGQLPMEEHYWPVTYSVLWLEWHLWGNNPAAFHVVNCVLHGLIVVQLWRLMRRIGLKGAWLGAALFAVHPVQVESIAWVINLKGLLAAAFYLLAIVCYLNHEDRGGRKWLVWTVVFAAAAMLSKSSPVILPATLAILIWYRRGRFEKRDVVNLAVLAEVVAALALLDMWAVRQMPKIPVEPPAFLERLAQSGWAFWLYAKTLVWPFGVTIFYPQFKIDIHRLMDWMPLIALLAATAGIWLARKKIGRGPFACWAYYVVALAPILGVVFFNFLRLAPAADRYQYLAIMGPLAGFGALAGAWVERAALLPNRILRALPAAALVALLGFASWHQSGFYLDQETLFRHAVKASPNSAAALYNLGATLNQKQRFNEAEKCFVDAIRLEPDDWQAVCNLGTLMLFENRYTEAIAVYDAALARGCRDLAVRSNFAWILASAPDEKYRNPARAIQIAEQLARESNEQDSASLGLLSAAQAANGRMPDAVATAQRARKLALDTGNYEQAEKLSGMLAKFENGDPYIIPRE